MLLLFADLLGEVFLRYFCTRNRLSQTPPNPKLSGCWGGGKRCGACAILAGAVRAIRLVQTIGLGAHAGLAKQLPVGAGGSDFKGVKEELESKERSQTCAQPESGITVAPGAFNVDAEPQFHGDADQIDGDLVHKLDQGRPQNKPHVNSGCGTVPKIEEETHALHRKQHPERAGPHQRRILTKHLCIQELRVVVFGSHFLNIDCRDPFVSESGG